MDLDQAIVLRGMQQDDHGIYRAGTLLVNPPGSSHRVISEEGCIALAIWQRPIRLLAPDD